MLLELLNPAFWTRTGVGPRLLLQATDHALLDDAFEVAVAEYDLNERPGEYEEELFLGERNLKEDECGERVERKLRREAVRLGDARVARDERAALCRTDRQPAAPRPTRISRRWRRTTARAPARSWGRRWSR